MSILDQDGVIINVAKVCMVDVAVSNPENLEKNPVQFLVCS